MLRSTSLPKLVFANFALPPRTPSQRSAVPVYVDYMTQLKEELIKYEEMAARFKGLNLFFERSADPEGYSIQLKQTVKTPAIISFSRHASGYYVGQYGQEWYGEGSRGFTIMGGLCRAIGKRHGIDLNMPILRS